MNITNMNGSIRSALRVYFSCVVLLPFAATSHPGPAVTSSLLRRRCLAPAFANGPQLWNTKAKAKATAPLHLNRILFDTSEVDDEPASSKTVDSDLLTVTLSKDDYRTVHVSKILGLQNGDTLRAGLVKSPLDENNKLGGLTTDEATVTWIPEGKIKKARPTKSGCPPGSLRVSIPRPPRTEIEGGAENLCRGPPVSLLLALPRPLQLGRILPMVSQLGVDQLILTNAKKVPKDYFGSHILRKPEVLRGLLVEGLAQSGDVNLPKVMVIKQLKPFVEDELDKIFPPEEVARVVAHPRPKTDGDEEGEVDCLRRMSSIDFPVNGPRRILVAVGPEGGWEEPYELEMFSRKGFQQISMGARVLRSDVAVVSILALAHEVCATVTSRSGNDSIQ